MTGTERVRNTILGLPTDRQPIYGWVFMNLEKEINARWGSVANFEDHYEFDAAHIFGGPAGFDMARLEQLRAENEELTPEIALQADIFTMPDDLAQYESIAKALAFHKARGRFCYVQTPGFFEHFNSVFGIENQLLYTALYTEELTELYRRQTEWTIRFADRCIDLGADMIHISDDWGAQKDLMFNPRFWQNSIRPYIKQVVDHVHARGAFVSLHSDGCIRRVCDGIAQLGIDVVHPWQESAGMSYDFYLEKYADRFAIMGGFCVQTAFGRMSREKLEAEIRRVFGLLRHKRWICCTTHFVQSTCSMDELAFAYDLIYRLARE